MKPIFSDWILWERRAELHNQKYPGIYAIAISSENLSNKAFSLIYEICYFGMTNSKGGLKSRLRQFDNTIKGKSGHGGAQRFRFKHPDYETLTSSLYVATCAFPCDVDSHLPTDLRIMGKVANYEYECFAQFVEKFDHLPEFNDMKRSPKN